MTGRLADLFRWINDRYGLNFSPFTDAFDGQRFLLGLRTTIELSLTCILLSILLGMLGAWMLSTRSALARGAVRAYVQAFRNTPPLVQLAFFYFAVGSLLPTVSDAGARSPLIDGYGWAVISFSLLAGAFNVEIFRSGVEAVPRTMVEAAEGLGFSRLQTYRYVLAPLGLRICLPALTNNLVNLVKTTTLAYAIGVPELLYAASQIWSEVLNVREMMYLLLVIYIALVAILVGIMERWERALRIPGYAP
ncbi:MAG: amino acid ABC transporter permease [Acetobacteraceae bacterium]|jgi:polar amino acid transport system permease protein